MKLTPKEIENMKPRDKEFLVPDEERLFLRVRPDRPKAWIFIYQWEGKRIKMAMHGDSITQIRATARQYNDWLDNGIRQDDGRVILTSPKHHLEAQEKQKEHQQLIAEQEKIQAMARLTVQQLFDRWESLELANHKGSGKEIRRMFEKDVLPVIGGLFVEDVRKAHIVEISNNILARGVNRMAKMMLALMRQMFRFAIDQDIIENDPTASIRKGKIGGADVTRDRVLSEDDIKLLAKAFPESGLTVYSQNALWILLSTCARVGELSKARWEHIDQTKRTWTIPATNAKNGKQHVIHLSEFALSKFQKLADLSQSSEWVLPNSKGDGHVCEKSLTKQVGDRQQSLKNRKPMNGRSKRVNALVLSGEKWTPHDLRRTGATIMGELSVSPDVIERCLNHTEQNKMKKTYQHQILIAEQQSAWALLGQRLELLISNNPNIITMPKRA